MKQGADIGMIGLAVMGQNLVLNLADHGYTVAVYNRTQAVTDDFVEGPAAASSIKPTTSLQQLVQNLKPPRRVMMMIKAGGAVDAVIEQLIPLLEPGDIIIDGGNSLFTDSMRRTEQLEAKGLRFIGTGISGGEEGARHGPSIMPGGTTDAWTHVRDMFQAIAAKVADGTPCADWVGPNGAGHYVKMVHNGIEYGDMQVIAEAYQLLRATGMPVEEAGLVFEQWNEGVLKSFLIDITADILAHRDKDGSPLVDQIVDAAGQKGTGKWTVVSSMQLAQPVTLIGEAVMARMVSALKDERMAAAGILAGPSGHLNLSNDDVEQALYASKIVSYAQGFMLLRAAAAEYGWPLDLGRIASLWREGCIIRAAFLDDITSAYLVQPDLPNLMLDPFFTDALAEAQQGLRRAVAAAAEAGLPVPAYATALSFYDAYRAERLPANLIQAMRDYFGAHTYERVDEPRGTYFHTDWTGRGGKVTSGSYQA
jgi:6-phosphogluconate dehydrogenase